ncbi:capsular biosynthesis protein [Aeromonas bestiarum]|uniref:capsular biosynthesis protein n=1 Tax=Aeromonas bestiarum TaxID=105751 RepID=UPI00366D4FF1
MNSALMMQANLLLSLVICGLAQYATGITAFLWLPFLLAIATLLLLPLQTRYGPLQLDYQEKVLLSLYCGLLMLALLGTLLQQGAMVTLIGFKNELALSLLLPCLLLGFCRESQIYRIMRLVDWVFYLQLPVVLFQVLVIVPKRVALHGEFEKWDSVVGTFGGDPMGGGNTGALGFFCLLVMLVKLSEFRHGLLSLRSVVLHILLAFTICVLGEVKFIILLSPLLLAWVWLSPSYVRGMQNYDIKRLLLIVLAMGGLVVVAIFLLSASYSSAFEGAEPQGPLDLFIDSLGYVFDPNHINPETGELGRVTTLFFWASNGDHHGLSNLLFGYGLNTTNHGSTMPGFLNPLFNVLLDSTSLSVLLWEVGLVGVALFIGLVGLLLWCCRPRPLFVRDRLSEADVRLLSYQPAFIAFGIGCLLSLPYSQLLMLIPVLQFIFYFVLGSALVIRSSVRQASCSSEAS